MDAGTTERIGCIVYTENARERIKKALIALLHRQSINQIQVNELVDAAKVSRSSFYRNYNTVYDVVEEIEKEFFDGIRAINRDNLQTRIGSDINVADRYILSTLRYLRERADILLALSGPGGDPAFYDKTGGLLMEYFVGKMAVSHKKVEYSDFYLECIRPGHVHVLRYWLSERPDVSEEEMAVIMAKLMYGYFYL